MLAAAHEHASAKTLNVLPKAWLRKDVVTENGEAYGLGEVSGLGTLSKVGGSAGVAEGCATGGGGGGVEAGVAAGVAEACGVGVGFAFGETGGAILFLRGICTVGAADGFLAFDGLLSGTGIKRTEIGFG
jgi:hypothetical protein